MQVKYTAENRITIPKEIRDYLGLKPNSFYNMDVVDGNIVLYINHCVNKENSDVKNIDKESLDNTQNLNQSKNKPVVDVSAINENKEKINQRISKLDNTVLKPVKYNHNAYCSNCKGIFISGFEVDDEFMCKSCTSLHFKQYLILKGGKRDV